MERTETKGSKPCPRCGRAIPVKACSRSRTLQTLHGEVTYRRNYHYCGHCQEGFYPLDAQIQVAPEGDATKGLAARVMDFAITAPYQEAAERFHFHYGLALSTHFMRCWVDRWPLHELEIGKGALPLCDAAKVLTLQMDGGMVPMVHGQWREAKVATIVTDDQHAPGAKGKRGMVSQASYVATLQPVEVFEARIRQRLPCSERLQRLTTVVVADGALWCWELAGRVCPQAVQILDWVHALEHGIACGKDMLQEQREVCELWNHRIRTLLWEGQIDVLISELYACLEATRSSRQKEPLKKLIHYYEANQKRMNYRVYRDAGYLIGSGLVESAHRHVVQVRMKRAGQHWSEKGALKMVQLRAYYKTVGPLHFADSLFEKAA